MNGNISRVTSPRRRFLGQTACVALGSALFSGSLLRQPLSAKEPAIRLVVDDPQGLLGQTQAPVTADAFLGETECQAALVNRLWLREQNTSGDAPAIPVQCLPAGGKQQLLCWLMPPGRQGKREFTIEIGLPAKVGLMQSRREIASGQYDLIEGDRLVLRYNYAVVEPGEVLKKVTPNNLKYAVARSNYLHPLYGPTGEVLTRDWSPDHPHHRGIYWAWPEVDWRGQRGDLHALQKIFARPTGQCVISSGPVFAQVDAENVWKWEDSEAIVRERTILRAYRATPLGRVLDLEFQFTALNEPVSVARRGASHYGGLNVRFSTVQNQQITKQIDPAGSSPLKAWGEVHGAFGGANQPAGVVILQSANNPVYPGDWAEYPNLNWLQPTFPASGTRHEITKDRPLVLHYRIWIYGGAKADSESCARQWEAANAKVAPCVLTPTSHKL